MPHARAGMSKTTGEAHTQPSGSAVPQKSRLIVRGAASAASVHAHSMSAKRHVLKVKLIAAICSGGMPCAMSSGFETMMYAGVAMQLSSRKKLPISMLRPACACPLAETMMMQPPNVSRIPNQRVGVLTFSVPSSAVATIVKMGCDGCQSAVVKAPARATPIRLPQLPMKRKKDMARKRSRNGPVSSSPTPGGRTGSLSSLAAARLLHRQRHTRWTRIIELSTTAVAPAHSPPK